MQLSEKTIDLNNFEEDPSYFENFELLASIKSFKLQEIRRRYNKSKDKSRTGSVERREPAVGGIAHLKIKNGNLIESELMGKIIEARGIDLTDVHLTFSSDNKVISFSAGSPQPAIIKNDWFSYIHTVKWNSTNNRLLVTSSGADILMELERDSWDVKWEWLAWENGINRGVNPETGEEHILMRSPEKYVELKNDQDIQVILIENPSEYPLPTALRAAFINCANYDSANNEIIATLFHSGEVIKIDRFSAEYNSIIKGLTKPHGGESFEDGYLITDTAAGKVKYLEQNQLLSYVFSNLPGKHPDVKNLEWLQTSHSTDNTIVTIDSNRSNLTFFDVNEQKRMHVNFDPNWAVQDFVFVPDRTRELIDLSKNYFKKHKDVVH